MTPFVLILCTYFTTNIYGQVYQQPNLRIVYPPSIYPSLPPNHKPAPHYAHKGLLPQHSTPNSAAHYAHLPPQRPTPNSPHYAHIAPQQSTPNSPAAYAALEIFKQMQVPENHKPAHMEVFRYPQTQIQKPAEPIKNTSTTDPTDAAVLGTDYYRSLDVQNLPNPVVGSNSAHHGLIGLIPTIAEDFQSAFPQQSEPLHGLYPVQNSYYQQHPFHETSFGGNFNLKKAGEIIDGKKKPKLVKKKYNLMPLKKSPKKYRTNPKKKINQPKITGKQNVFGTAEQLISINPTSEVIHDFSDMLKNKRKIPYNTYKENKHNAYSEPNEYLDSYNDGKPSEYKEPEKYSSYSEAEDLKDYSDYTKPYPLTSQPFSEQLNSFTPHKTSPAPFSSPGESGNGDRVEFQMYGMDGPHSYKFGYDTGEGHNRHFRFEERDNEGKVKGHYGYYDQEGKMTMMRYEADPHHGFKAGPYKHPENHHEFH